jgi:hypothetical protein
VFKIGEPTKSESQNYGEFSRVVKYINPNGTEYQCRLSVYNMDVVDDIYDNDYYTYDDYDYDGYDMYNDYGDDYDPFEGTFGYTYNNMFRM